MDKRSLKVLEFNKIKKLLSDHVSSTLGRERVLDLTPSGKMEEVIRWQEETDEAATVYRLKGTVPLSGIFDIRTQLKRADIGGMLSAQELTEVSSTIRASRQIKRFIEELSDEEINLAFLPEMVERIVVLSTLQTAIDEAVDPNGDILDSASDQLRTIRNQMRTNERRVRERLDQILRSSSGQKRLSETIVTIRNERFVIPVKQEYRNYYGGVVHDQSASGQTLFIEPQSIVQLNNELQHSRVKEQLEMERVLIALSIEVSKYQTELYTIVQVLGDIDFIFAKARFGKTMNGSKPLVNQEGKIDLFKARHPLIPADEVVANDIFLGTDFTTIVITGPNTGGKTVALKTVGLCTLMAQAGLQIPALDGSQVAVFDAVYADIGDEQSIEQSLSTFSSHMVNIVHILEKADANSLVLFDELGAGTDPQEGTALAISILDEVYARGARVIATTHYPELKAYGYDREGVVNASVEFDVETLSPTYKLLIGVPGRSNAFEIAKRLGLSDQIIQNAQSFVHVEDNKVEQMIVSLEQSRRQAEEEEKATAVLLKEAEALHKELQEQIEAYEEQKEALYEKAQKESREVVNKAKQEAEVIMKELRNMRLDKQAEVKEHELIEARRRLDDAAPKIDRPTSQIKRTKKAQAYAVGDEVNVTSLNQKGILVERLNDTEWQVQMGILKMKVAEEDMKYVSTPKEVKTRHLTTIRGRDAHVNSELDLRGERYEEALRRVEKYIDDALLANYAQVTIIHGKGTGALRDGVQSYLQRHRSVKEMRFGEPSEGGSGVTVVLLK